MKRVLLGLMACLVSAVLASTPVLAAKPQAMFAEGPGFTVTVYHTIPCTSKKVAKVLKDAEAPFTIKTMVKAQVKVDGKKINACVEVNLDMGFAMIVGEDARGSVLPLDVFVPLTGV